jgi:hypothetical protein
MKDEASNSRRHRRIATTIALLLTVSSLAAPFAAAQGGEERLGEVLWPPEDARAFSDLAELGASAFDNGTQPAKLGLGPVQSLELNAESSSSTEIVVKEEGGERISLVQPHDSTDVDGHVTLPVRPSDLRPVVEVRLETQPTASYVLTLTGPPGSVALDGTTLEEKVESFAEHVGLPLEGTTVGIETTSFPHLFGGERGCFEKTNGTCQSSAAFAIECDSCTLALLHGPSGDSDVDSSLSGVGLALFDDSDRLVAVTVSYAFDVDESEVLDRSTARDEAADRLRDRGYQVDGKPSVDDVVVRTVLADREVAVEEVRYGWRFAVSENSSASEGGNGSAEPVPPGGGIAEIQQDAATGDLASLKIDPADVSEDTDANDSRENTTRPPNERNESTDPAPAPGLAVVGAILGALAAVLARPRS